jgi:putative iron-regulated protein
LILIIITKLKNISRMIMKLNKNSIVLSSLLATSILFTACDADDKDDTKVETAVKQEVKEASEKELHNVLVNYANMADAMYTDTVATAKTLQTAIIAFTDAPTETTLQAAKDAWKDSRVPYLKAEAFRLANGPIDAEGTGTVADEYGALEGQLNAWPLDENMIDYTIDGDENAKNIINTIGAFTPNGDGAEEVNIETITKEALTALNENGGDANVATGYHAIEFLLWGQDPHNTEAPTTAGQRPVSDYTTADFADRRKAYLLAVTEKMVMDLETVASAWKKGDSKNYRSAFLGEHEVAANNLDTLENAKTILAGLGVYIASEVANERIAVAVQIQNQEDEHSCFSDNTHVDVTEDIRGFWNILNGEYAGLTAETTINKDSTESFMDLVAEITPNVATDVNALYGSYWAKVELMNESVANFHFDHQILDTNEALRKNINDMKNELRDQGNKMIDIAEVLNISLSPGQVRDPEETTVPAI